MTDSTNVWNDIRESQFNDRILTGVLGRLHYGRNGKVSVIVNYKGLEVEIPSEEMGIVISRPHGESDTQYQVRTIRILEIMLGAEVDFIICLSCVENGSIIASRDAAMRRLRKWNYLGQSPNVTNGQAVLARVIAVTQLAVRVEFMGAEATINNEHLSWGFVGNARDKFQVGDTVLVRIEVFAAEKDGKPEDIRIKADIRSLTEDTSIEKLKDLKLQEHCSATIEIIESIRGGEAYYLNLCGGIRGVAYKNYSKSNRPKQGDTVVFSPLYKDVKKGLTIGTILRVTQKKTEEK